MLESSFHKVEWYVRRKGLHALIWFDCGMNSKEVHGSLRQFPTDQLQGHRIKKVELKLLTGAFFATDKIPHRPTLLIHQQPLSYCSSNGSELVRLSGPWGRSSSWLRVPEIGAVQATFESSTQHLVANCGGMFEIIHLATGFILTEPPFLTDCVYNHECRILYICWRRVSGIGMFVMHVSSVYGIFWLVYSGLGWNCTAAAVFSAFWFQRLAADAIQSRQLSSTVAWAKICELLTCVKPTHAWKHRKPCN